MSNPTYTRCPKCGQLFPDQPIQLVTNCYIGGITALMCPICYAVEYQKVHCIVWQPAEGSTARILLERAKDWIRSGEVNQAQIPIKIDTIIKIGKSFGWMIKDLIWRLECNDYNAFSPEMREVIDSYKQLQLESLQAGITIPNLEI